MTIIRVTPEILAQTANRMTSVNGEIQAAIRDLSSVLNGIGGEYGGQLRNQVAPRVGQAQGAASGPTNQANALTLELNKRAQLFAAADLQSTAVAGASAQLVNRGNDTQFDVWALLAKLQLEDLLKLLAMGVLLGRRSLRADRTRGAGLHPGRREPGQQHAGLAVDRGLRRGRIAVLPHLQPGAAVGEVRPGRNVPAALGSRARRPHGRRTSTSRRRDGPSSRSSSTASRAGGPSTPTVRRAPPGAPDRSPEGRAHRGAP